jgi:hypothetical protein
MWRWWLAWPHWGELQCCTSANRNGFGLGVFGQRPDAHYISILPSAARKPRGANLQAGTKDGQEFAGNQSPADGILKSLRRAQRWKTELDFYIIRNLARSQPYLLRALRLFQASTKPKEPVCIGFSFNVASANRPSRILTRRSPPIQQPPCRPQTVTSTPVGQ